MDIDLLIDRFNALLEEGDAQALEQLLTTHPSLLAWLRSHFVSALCVAAAQDNAEILRLLLDLGANPNETDENQWTPLHHAAAAGAANTAFLLLARGANTEVYNTERQTPLFLSLKYNGIPGYAVLGLLLEHGAVIDLLTAIFLRQTHIVRCLIQDNPSLLQSTPFDRDALGLAALLGYTEIVRLLLQFGADVNKTGHYSLPLLAAMQGVRKTETEALLQLLLEHEADPRQKPADRSESPLAWAEANAPALVPLLLGAARPT